MGLPKVRLSSSGGKDSAWALDVLRQRGEYEEVGLATTVNERFRRVAIHGYREVLLDELDAAAGPPVEKVDLPMWGTPTDEPAEAMVAGGLRAYPTCVDPRVLGRSSAGRGFDAGWLRELPVGVDRCGERGEFHTFACAGPMFSRSISAAPAEVVARDAFVYAELLPPSKDSDA